MQRSRAAAAALAAALALSGAAPSAAAPPPGLDELIASGRAGRWDTLAIGETVARFGLALEGAPYLEKTLEGPGPEVCRVTTAGYDCVTFMELSLALARVLHAAPGDSVPDADDVIAAITATRYRAGRLDGYLSRLHYTSEWIADNAARGIVADVTIEAGGSPLALAVGFMSSHPGLYPALRDSAALRDSMRAIESRINRAPRAVIPRERVRAIESRLRTGDLVAIATAIPGLDYSHTGVIVREGPRARLLHASSKLGRVTLDQPLGDYLAAAPRHVTGITIARPQPLRR